MKKFVFAIILICTLFSVGGCSAKNECDCAQKYLYRKTVYATNYGWKEETNLYEQLPEGAEIIEIIDMSFDSNYPKYDVIYTIHNCK